jgi:hypothetical protein
MMVRARATARAALPRMLSSRSIPYDIAAQDPRVPEVRAPDVEPCCRVVSLRGFQVFGLRACHPHGFPHERGQVRRLARGHEVPVHHDFLVFVDRTR